MKPSIVLLTPIMPQAGGNGLAMRAGLVLAGLARHWDVDLFVCPVAGGPREPPPFVTRHARRIGLLDLSDCADAHAKMISRVRDPGERARQMLAYPRPWLSRFCTQRAADRLRQWLGPDPPSAVHLMRLYLAPFVEHEWLAPLAARPAAILDLDDDEGSTRRGLADLHDAAGDAVAAGVERAEAGKYDMLAARLLPRFDRVLTCSDDDAERLALVHPGARFAVLPNACPLPDPPALGRPRRDGPLRLLFVGTLDYPPNAGAVRYLADAVVPVLARHNVTAQIDVVGPRASPGLTSCAARAGLRLAGQVEDLRPWYAAADIAVVPLRAGGGTRIKVLEAFAHGVPVVASGTGAAGLGLVHEQHYLRADDAETMACACERLHRNPELARRLAAEALALLRRHFTPACVHARLAGIYAGLELDVR